MIKQTAQRSRASSMNTEGGYEGIELISTARRTDGEPFVTMLRVDVATGEILLNRMAEVMGDVFAAYSRGSAFERRRVG